MTYPYLELRFDDSVVVVIVQMSAVRWRWARRSSNSRGGCCWRWLLCCRPVAAVVYDHSAGIAVGRPRDDGCAILVVLHCCCRVAVPDWVEIGWKYVGRIARDRTRGKRDEKRDINDFGCCLDGLAKSTHTSTSQSSQTSTARHQCCGRERTARVPT